MTAISDAGSSTAETTGGISGTTTGTTEEGTGSGGIVTIVSDLREAIREDHNSGAKNVEDIEEESLDRMVLTESREDMKKIVMTGPDDLRNTQTQIANQKHNH